MTLTPTQDIARNSPAARAAGKLALTGVAAAAGCMLLNGLARGSRVRKRPAPAESLRDAAAMLCASVLTDSATEHYRGSFQNPGMYAPLIASALGLLASRRSASRSMRRNSYGLLAVTGALGLAFHAFNITRRPGGVSWQNLFYAAPIGAPAALILAAALGGSAQKLDDQSHNGDKEPAWRPGRAICALSSFGLAGTVAEAGLLHFRGSFQNPFMWLPMAVPPVAAAGLARAALAAPRSRPLTRLWLKATAVLGALGVVFHAIGISRAMGGWRNWQQNLLDGPPLPAPPSFSALALAGLAALHLREKEDV